MHKEWSSLCAISSSAIPEAAAIRAWRSIYTHHPSNLAGLGGISVLAAGTNPLTATLGAANLLLYVGPYTLSKTRSELNTWVGSIVGAIPPLMGWAAATGEVVAAEPLLLAAYLFIWQFPHFFSLAWLHREDYARGGFAMVSFVVVWPSNFDSCLIKM